MKQSKYPEDTILNPPFTNNTVNMFLSSLKVQRLTPSVPAHQNILSEGFCHTQHEEVVCL